jgi:hypothetical protein
MPAYKVWRMVRASQGDSAIIPADSPEDALRIAREDQRTGGTLLQNEYTETEFGFEGWEVHDVAAGLVLSDPIDDPATATPEERYIASNGTTCPSCGHDDPQGDSFTSGNGAASQEMSCPECGATWTDCYVLSGIVGLETADA